MVSGRGSRVLVAFNSDYYLSRIGRELDAEEGITEVILYDETLLISSNVASSSGIKQAYVIRDLKLSESESGRFEYASANWREMLSFFHALPLYPLLVVTHLDQDYAPR